MTVKTSYIDSEGRMGRKMINGGKPHLWESINCVRSTRKQQKMKMIIFHLGIQKVIIKRLP